MAKALTFREKFYTYQAPIIVGVGASIVIIGALFKIQHWPFSGPILTAGMLVEAVIFMLFAFAPIPHDTPWERVYPQLDDEYWASLQKQGYKPAIDAGAGQSQKSVVKSVDEMLNQAKIDQQLVDRLGNGFRSLSESVTKIGEVANASVATKEYATNVKTASSALMEMNKSYAETAKAMGEMSHATTAAKDYQAQVVNVTKNLGALNAVYEMEIKDANNHLKAMNQYYGQLTQAMNNVAQTSKDTEQLKHQMSGLTQNLQSLNSVYGNMLSAMRSGAAAAASAPAAQGQPAGAR